MVSLNRMENQVSLHLMYFPEGRIFIVRLLFLQTDRRYIGL